MKGVVLTTEGLIAVDDELEDELVDAGVLLEDVVVPALEVEELGVFVSDKAT